MSDKLFSQKLWLQLCTSFYNNCKDNSSENKNLNKQNTNSATKNIASLDKISAK